MVQNYDSRREAIYEPILPADWSDHVSGRDGFLRLLVLMLICICGHEGPLAENLFGRVVCSHCKRAQEFASFDSWTDFERWRLSRIWRGVVPREPAFRVAWKATV